MEKSDPLIRTKYQLPLIRQSLVPRRRLQEQIEQGLRSPLTLVIAPAGFGKTTLVAAAVVNCGMAVAWLSLDKDDNQPGRFLDYWVAAVRTADPTLGKDAAQLLTADRQISPEAVLTTLINDLDASPREIILVLDDYQFISDTAVHAQVSFVLEHHPKTLHLMIVTRSDPPLPFARLRARGQTLELRASDLRFTESEASQFLNDVMGLHVDPKLVATLEERTEGWIAGLQMAALSMRDRKNVAGFIEGFSGTNRYILDYLMEEVLGNQSPEIQRFLLCTSILERLSAPLCDYMLTSDEDIHPSASILNYLERANIFLVPLDDERRWYRYHHLFSDLLRAQWKHSPYSDDQKSLHGRASKWYEMNGFPEDAIQHALAAEDDLTAARQIESAAENAWLDGQYARILAWIKALPEDLVRTRPWLCLWNAWAYTQLGIPENIQHWIDAAQQCIANEAEDSQSLINEIAALKVFVVSFSQDYQHAIALAEDSLKGPPLKHKKASQFIRCNILHLLSSMYFSTGQIYKVEQTCLDTIALAEEIGFTLRYVHSINKLVLVYKVTGRLVLADQTLEATQSYLRGHGYSHYFAVLQLYFRKIELLYEWNRLEDVQNLLDLVIKKETMIELPYLQVDFHNIQAHILLTQGEYGGAQQELDQAMALARQTYIWEGLAWRTEWLQTRLWLQKGDRARVAAWVAEGAEVSSDVNPFSNEGRMVARARILWAQGDCEGAISLLERIAQSAERGGRRGSLIEILALKAIVLHQAGRSLRAITEIEKALTLAQPESYVRTFVDEGEPMKMLLRHWAAGTGATALRDYTLHILGQFDADAQDVIKAQQKSSAKDDLIEPLTPRELEVLRLVAAGLSNRQIAEKLFLAEGTVKFYMHALMEKFGVHSRTQALASARERNLL